nr:MULTISPECIES: M50 family metallopeptidase [Paenibacillus]
MKTILFLIGSVFLTRWIPFSSLFRNLDTMIHEFGHAAVTLLLSGRVLRIELYADHSGVTYSAVQAGFRSVLVALAGYTSASLFALLLFRLYVKGRKDWGLILSTAVAVVMLALYVRGSFGMLWLTGFACLNMIMLMAGNGIRTFYYLLLAFLTLEESVVGALYLVFAAAGSPGGAGDATNLARLTGVPAVFWAILFLAFALICAKWALGAFFQSKGTLRMSKRAVYPEKE